MVQGNCTPNLDQIFARLLFRRDHFHSCSLISLFKISYYNSNHAPSLRGPLNKINNRYDTIFFLLRVDHQVSEEVMHQIQWRIQDFRKGGPPFLWLINRKGGGDNFAKKTNKKKRSTTVQLHRLAI